MAACSVNIKELGLVRINMSLSELSYQLQLKQDGFITLEVLNLGDIDETILYVVNVKNINYAR